MTRPLSSRSPATAGFTLIELLIVTFIIGTTIVGVFGLFVLSLRTAQEGERRVVAVALANERMEMIRNLPYVDVGTQGGLPAGPIVQEEEIARNTVTYTVRTDIRYVDDEYDGLVPADTLNTDYKQARVEVSWPSPNAPRSVLQITHIAPPGVEGGETAGTLDFQALSASGQGVAAATVRLLHAALDPPVDITTQTDNQGRVLLPGVPEATGSYQLTVNKPGFTAEQTYDTTVNFIPDADHGHLSALQGTVTEKTFFIDQVSSVAITTQGEDELPVGLVSYGLRGTKTIGTDGLGDPVYVVDLTGQTDAGGRATEESLVWDAYDFTIDGAATGYDIKETSLLLPLTVDPGGVLDLIVTLVDHTPISLHVTVTTPTGDPVDNATVQLTGSGFDETDATGVLGQVLFGALPTNGDYALVIAAPGFEGTSTTVTVGNTTRFTVALTSL